MNNWPDIPADQIDRRYRATFIRNRQIIDAVLRGRPYREIARDFNVSPGRISALYHKALGGDDAETPLLTKALIPYQRHTKHRRRSPLSTDSKMTGGQCSLSHLLESVSGLKDGLDAALIADINARPHATNHTPKTFHSLFLYLLTEANHPKTQYPFTHGGLAYESVRKYFHQRRSELEIQKIQTRSMRRKRIISPKREACYYCRKLQLDEHLYDGQCKIYIDLDGHHIPLRISRFSVIVLADVDTNCALAFDICLTKHPSQFDVLKTLEAATIYTSPPQLATDGLTLPEGAAFPNQVSRELANTAFDFVALDNALAHCATSIEEYLCDTHCSTLQLGLPAQPLTRRLIEHINAKLATHAHRLKSTSGKSVTDPMRETRQNRKRPPAVTLTNLIEIIYSCLALHNTTPAAHLGGAAPIDLVQHLNMSHPGRPLCIAGATAPTPFHRHQQVRVKWLRKENRRPHINFQYLRYFGNALDENNLVGKEVIIEYDYRDIRELVVKTLEGDVLGPVRAPMSWQKYPHGIKTRQYIFQYMKKERIKLKDPLTEFFLFQLRNPSSESATLKAFKLYREYVSKSEIDISTIPRNISLTSMRDKENTPDTRDDLPFTRSVSKIPDWSINLIHSEKTDEPKL